MSIVYILKLTNNKYYIGRVNYLNTEVSNTNEWIKKYKPISLLYTINNCSKSDEDKYTVDYMSKYGINNVRGGTFDRLILPTYQIDTLNDMLSINNKILRHKKTKYYRDDCFKKEDYYCFNCSKKVIKEYIINDEYDYEFELISQILL